MPRLSKAHNVVEFPRPDPDLAEEARIATVIVCGIRSGSVGAETDLIDRYGRGLRRLLVRRIGDEARAGDLLQRTLSIAIARLRSTDIDNPGRLAAYLRGIAIRVAKDASRTRRREPDDADVEALSALRERVSTRFENVSRSQSADAVRRLLATMPLERDRELLVRYYFRAEDKDDICAALNLTDSHFNRVLYRAKTRFRELLREGRAIAGTAQPADR